MAETKFLEDFEAHLSRPEDYLDPTPELKAHCLAGVKTVFDLLQKRCRRATNGRDQGTNSAKAKKPKTTVVPSGPLQELYVDGFDLDQIWEQIQLVNEPLIAHLTKQVEKINRWDWKKLTDASEKGSNKVAVSDSDTDGMDDSESDHDQEDIQDDDYFSEEEDNELNDEIKKPTKKVGGGRKTVVDDKFFKLAEMEEFLEKIEKNQQRQRENFELDSDLESDEDDVNEIDDDIDYFADIPSDSELGDSGKTKRAHYDDFFDAPAPDDDEVKGQISKDRRQRGRDGAEKVNEERGESDGEEGESDEGEGESEEETEASSEGEEVGGESDEVEEDSHDEEGEKEEESDDENSSELDEEQHGVTEAMEEKEGEIVEKRAHQLLLSEEEEEEKEKQQTLSSYEKNQLKMKDRITSLEEANLEEKPWQMSGEATAKSRPENSLLQEFLSFEHMTCPAPVITDETTHTLEDIIKQRILDEAWDDVERRVKPKEKPFDYSQARPLNQEKSKLSLAEVYEQEYIKQTQTLDEVKEDDRHTEIKEMMKKLFVKLDALSNFHFTPKPPKPEVKIVANVPAIQMEEVAPVATSDAALLAPEEIQVKSKMPEIGATEKTETNRKRERRLKKKQKRVRFAEKRHRDKLVAKLKPGLGNKYTKKSFAKKLREREEEERVDTSLKSSSQFFARLQEQVREQVKGARAEESRTRKDRTTKSQQYKL